MARKRTKKRSTVRISSKANGKRWQERWERAKTWLFVASALATIFMFYVWLTSEPIVRAEYRTIIVIEKQQNNLIIRPPSCGPY